MNRETLSYAGKAPKHDTFIDLYAESGRFHVEVNAGGRRRTTHYKTLLGAINKFYKSCEDYDVDYNKHNEYMYAKYDGRDSE